MLIHCKIEFEAWMSMLSEALKNSLWSLKAQFFAFEEIVLIFFCNF